jgi:hypothetical protein
MNGFQFGNAMLTWILKYSYILWLLSMPRQHGVVAMRMPKLWLRRLMFLYLLRSVELLLLDEAAQGVQVALSQESEHEGGKRAHHPERERPKAGRSQVVAPGLELLHRTANLTIAAPEEGENMFLENASRILFVKPMKLRLTERNVVRFEDLHDGAEERGWLKPSLYRIQPLQGCVGS